MNKPAVPHVHIVRSASRLDPARERLARVHRDQLRRKPPVRALSVEVFDALVHAIRCQGRRESVATLDSALHHGLVGARDVAALRAALPRRLQSVCDVVDARAESGPESLMRLVLREMGCRAVPQVSVATVGRVDFLVNDWLVVECDSAAFHGSWQQQRSDRRRDQLAARRGFVTYRPIAEDIMWHPERVRAAVAGLLAWHAMG